MIVTQKHYVDTDELYEDMYHCPKCQNYNITDNPYIRIPGVLFKWFNYCPVCGIELEWDID